MYDGATFWPLTILVAAIAVALAAVGLALEALGAAPILTTSLLVASLMSTGAAFTRLAMRLRRMELENEGLIEELSQEFDKVKGRLDGVSQAILQRSLTPEEENEPMRRVVVK